MAIQCCLPASTALQDHVPVTFKKNSCHLLVSPSSINSLYYICGDFNIHADVPVGDGYKFMNFLDLCDQKQSVNKPTHLHGHILDLILCPVIRILFLMSKFVILYLIKNISQMHISLPSSSGSHTK